MSGSLPLHLVQDWLPASVVSANPSSGGLAVKAALRNVAVGSVMALAGRAARGRHRRHVRRLARTCRPTAWRLEAVAGTVRIDRAGAVVRDVAITQVDARRDPRAQRRGERRRVAVAGRAHRPRAARVSSGSRSPSGRLRARGARAHRHRDRRARSSPAGRLATFAPTSTSRRVDGKRRGQRRAGRLEKGAWVDRDLQIALSDLSGTVRLQTDRVIVEGMPGRLNGGEVTVSGAMNRVAATASSTSGALSLSGPPVDDRVPGAGRQRGRRGHPAGLARPATARRSASPARPRCTRARCARRSGSSR